MRNAGVKRQQHDNAATALFESDVSSAFNVVQTALRAVVAQIPGTPARPTDLQRAVGVDFKICWCVNTVIRAVEPLLAARHVPSPAAAKRFLKACVAGGVPEPVVDETRQALEDFGRLARRYASSRQAFDAMLAGAAIAADRVEGEDVEIEHRRSVHRGLSYMWGREVETFRIAAIARRSASGKGIDMMTLNSKIGVRRFRADARTDIYSERLGAGRFQYGGQSRPIVPPIDESGTPLIPQFCTKPLPKMRTEVLSREYTATQITNQRIGMDSAVDLTFGTITRNVDFIDEGQGPWFESVCLVTIPTVMFQFDALIHRPSLGSISPQVSVLTNADTMPGMGGYSQHLPNQENAACLGPAHRVRGARAPFSEIALYRYATSQVDWDLGAFDLWRVRIRFPLLFSAIRLRFFV